MLKAGIYLDIENLVRNGGRGMRFHVIRDLVEAQGATVLRACAYLAVDKEREQRDMEYRRKGEDYRNVLRRQGYHVMQKEVRRFRDEEGNLAVKANADLDMAVDALLQSDNLDYLLLGTGDGDFLRLVQALQNRGRRVDALSFSNTSHLLRQQVDTFFPGYLVHGLLPHTTEGPPRLRGVLHAVNEEKGYGFITLRTGLGHADFRDDIFCHITDLRLGEMPVSNEEFSRLRERSLIIEFELQELPEGKVKAVNGRVLSASW
ncbi:MAG: NYN domain-containing protein [Calditrichaeota bacterium]|nr:NYN domain-containing protein [Candidatus Cloacimonadota bacterium]MCA9787801.1 NYN domain-containing protein [Candidatus Cloacimonadota bacterium]MCB1047510.1 NYN domain-containing protein [Calditrichota bacterium]MCB9472503.1 NYN domain-containing protein [Candidatus Delongbacteria bacterium]